MKYFTYSLLFTCLFAFSAYSQGIQSPSEFLGHRLGESFTSHHHMVAYMRHLAEQSSKAKIEQYGETYEGRELMLLYISSPENLENLEEIRLRNLSAARVEGGQTEGEHLPIVWLSYNIHGNESAGTEAAIATVYALLTGKKATDKTAVPSAIDEWLQNVVVVIDPCENPDGRERYVNWYRQTLGNSANPDRQAWEHHEPWPGGRYNHYHFDLNRDWAWQVLKESQARISAYQKWMPHVHVDLHEMGYNSPYFFGPSAKPFHEVITPWQRDYHELSGKFNAKYFDENGWLYFTSEVFDLFYPSYGDTWPTYNGAIGFTYEQGGSGRGGLYIARPAGDTLSLKDRLEHHQNASMGTIEAAFENREKLLEEFTNYFLNAETNPEGQYKSYVIKTTGQEGRVKALLELLEKQKIRYGYPASADQGYLGFHYQDRSSKKLTVESQDIIVSAYQPQSRLVQVLFEPEGKLEDSLTYDLTAWSLPYVYDVEAYAIRERISVSGEEVNFPFTKNTVPAQQPYAFVAEWKDFQAVKFLASLLQEDIIVRFTEEPFTSQGRKYGRGTMVITAADNQPKLASWKETVVEMANQHAMPLQVASTGLVEGGKDFGSSAVRLVQKPKVALMNGSGVSPTSFGEAWFYFEEELHYPVSVINTQYVDNTDLSSYDVLVLPSGSYSKFSNDLVDFAMNGGKIIAMEQAVGLFSSNVQTHLSEALSRSKEKNHSENGEDLLKTYADSDRRRASKRVEGSIYKMYLDNTHPLAFGEDASIYIVKRNSKEYPYMDEGGWNVGVFKNDSHTSGFTGNEVKNQMKNTLGFGTERLGQGHVVYMTDSPIFRGFWYSGKLLMGNAVFFVGQ